MPLFFIEMGQGIIARGDVRVRTSTLYSCTLIVGYNQGSGYGGAYHYPSNRLDDPAVRADMDNWAAVLRPTAVTLIFALDASGAGMMGTPARDQFDLQQWVNQQCNVAPATTSAVGAGVELFVGGGFNAGNVAHLAGNFDPNQAIGVDNRTAGRYLDHGGFTLLGVNREQ
jgi:hypothetical protein